MKAPGVIALLLVGGLAVGAAVRLATTGGFAGLLGGPSATSATTPTAFNNGLTLDQAIARSRETGKPVVVVSSATWCPPCQQLKKTTLVDAGVESWLTENTIPVYLDVDQASASATSLGVRSIPDTQVLVNGQSVARLSGYAPAGEFLTFVKKASGKG